MQQYKAVKLLAETAESRMYKTIKSDTKEELSIQKIKITNESSNLNDLFSQEAYILQKLKHPNIVQFYDYIKTPKTSYLILQPLQYSLQEYLDLIHSKGLRLGEKQVSYILRQICMAVAYMEQNLIIHGDISARNIFFNQQRKLQIANFQFGQSLDPVDPFFSMDKNPYTNNYQPFYGAPQYYLQLPGPYRKSDAFAMGCLIPELYNCKPLLKADTDLNQLYQYCIILGTPEPVEWPDGHAMASKLRIVLPDSQGIELDGLIAGAGQGILDITRQLTRVNPVTRNSAFQSLALLGKEYDQVSSNKQHGKKKQKQHNQRYSSPQNNQNQFNILSQVYLDSSPSQRDIQRNMSPRETRNSVRKNNLQTQPPVPSSYHHNHTPPKDDDYQNTQMIYSMYHNTGIQQREKTAGFKAGNQRSFQINNSKNFSNNNSNTSYNSSSIKSKLQNYEQPGLNPAIRISPDRSDNKSPISNYYNLKTQESRQTQNLNYNTQDSRGSIYTRDSQINQNVSPFGIGIDPPTSQRYGATTTHLKESNLGHIMFMRNSDNSSLQSKIELDRKDTTQSMDNFEKQNGKIYENNKQFYKFNNSITNLEDGWDRETRNSNSIRDFDLRSHNINIESQPNYHPSEQNVCQNRIYSQTPTNNIYDNGNASRPVLSENESNRIINELRRKREALNGQTPALQLQTPYKTGQQFYHPNNKAQIHKNTILQRNNLDQSFDISTNQQRYISPMSARHAEQAKSPTLPEINLDMRLRRLSAANSNQQNSFDNGYKPGTRSSVSSAQQKTQANSNAFANNFSESGAQTAYMILPNSNEILPVLITPRKTPDFSNQYNKTARLGNRNNIINNADISLM